MYIHISTIVCLRTLVLEVFTLFLILAILYGNNSTFYSSTLDIVINNITPQYVVSMIIKSLLVLHLCHRLCTL